MSAYRGYFSIHPESAGELKSYSATSRSGKNTLRLEVAYDSAVELGYALDALAELAASLKAIRSEAKKPRLQLPAPAALK
ncbi:MAG: hypothetical protein KBF78_14160 [Fuscovulum sp.]|nr:hypothetical protein [Fuscovulum sp.]